MSSIFGQQFFQVKTINIQKGYVEDEQLKEDFEIRMSWSENEKQVIVKFGNFQQMNFEAF